MESYNVKIEINLVTIHDLHQIIREFLNEDYWSPENTIDIETVETPE